MGKKLIIKGADFSAVAIESAEPQRLVTTNGACSFSNTTLTLYNQNWTLGTKRLKSGELSGNYTITMNEGYVISTVIEYSPSINTLTPTSSTTGLSYTVQSGQVLHSGGMGLLSSYTYSGSKRTVITFAKSNTDNTISPTEDIGTIQYL